MAICISVTAVHVLGNNDIPKKFGKCFSTAFDAISAHGTKLKMVSTY